MTAVTCDGRTLPAAQYPELTVDGQFAVIQKDCNWIWRRMRRNFAKATFDPSDGHPTQYTRRVRGSGDRLEWNINLKKLTEDRPMEKPDWTPM